MPGIGFKAAVYQQSVAVPMPPKISYEEDIIPLKWGQTKTIQLVATGKQPITWSVFARDIGGGNLGADKVSIDENTGLLTIKSNASDEWMPAWHINVKALNTVGEDEVDIIVEWEP